MIPHFYLHPDALDYDFGPEHPLRPGRVSKSVRLIEHFAGPSVMAGTTVSDADLLRVHSRAYLEAVARIDEAAVKGSAGGDEILELRSLHGFWGDNPPFAGMDRAARGYSGSTAEAARAVRDGATLAFGIGGGLHHALREKASGFCIYDDPAIACSILRERFDRVAYVDIDVHHGDGVQWIFYDDPTVLTCSIHEEGKSLWPGTGWVRETGAELSSLNVPMQAGTTGDVWLEAFELTVIADLQKWRPEAIVLQMGADTHYLDPLAHINSNQESWLEAVKLVQALELPMVALGGGGYNLTTVPRMWASAVLTLAGVDYSDAIPAELAGEMGASTISDRETPFGPGGGHAHANRVIQEAVQTFGLF